MMQTRNTACRLDISYCCRQGDQEWAKPLKIWELDQGGMIKHNGLEKVHILPNLARRNLFHKTYN
jgi:hypothetical protein